MRSAIISYKSHLIITPVTQSEATAERRAHRNATDRRHGGGDYENKIKIDLLHSNPH